MSQFLGTGVVRAHRAESCGASGLRILLHPNLEPVLDKAAMRIVTVQPVPAALPVMSELNYLEEDSAQEVPREHGAHYLDVIPFDCLRSMIIESDERFHYHYIATFHAWNMMRAQFGREPYPWDKFIDRSEFERQNETRT